MTTFRVDVRTSFNRQDDPITRGLVIDAIRCAVEQAAEDIWSAQTAVTEVTTAKGVFPYIVVSRYEDDDLIDQMSK